MGRLMCFKGHRTLKIFFLEKFQKMLALFFFFVIMELPQRHVNRGGFAKNVGGDAFGSE